MSSYFKNKYEFLIDWFSYNIQYLQPFIVANKDIIKDALEIGSWEGMSACYFLDNLNLNSMTCIDPFYENSYQKFLTPQQVKAIENYELNQYNRFESNLKKTGQYNKCIVYKDFSQNVLPKLTSTYDFVFIDGLHAVDQVKIEFKYVYDLLRPNGYILFDDYTCVEALKNTIDSLINEKHMKTILSYRQLLVQKI